MHRFGNMSLLAYGRNNQEKYQTMLSQKADLLETNYFIIFPKAFMYTVSFIMAVVATFVMKPEITVVIILLSVPAIIVPMLGKRLLESLQDDVLEKIDAYTVQFMDIFRGFSTITRFLSFSKFLDKYDSSNLKLAESRTKNQRAVNFFEALNGLASDILYLGTWICGAYFVMKHEITIGQLVAFSQLVNFVSWPLQNVSELLASYYAGKRVIHEVETIFETAENQNLEATTQGFQVDTVEFKSVYVWIDDKLILNNITFTLDMKQRNVLIGKSGSGKSTLIKVLLQELPYEGSILLDGHELSTLNRADIYSYFGMVNQQNIIFDGTLAENVTMFAEWDATNLEKSMNKAGLNARIDDLNTVISNSSNKLSGGELRRVELARAIYHDYEFTIFDEVTSGLDPETAMQVQADVNGTNLGYLMITHDYRKSFLEKVDHITIINGGELVHDGSPSQVLKYIG